MPTLTIDRARHARTLAEELPPLYPDSAIEAALWNSLSFACYHATPPGKAKIAKARAEMLRIRDAAGARQGVEPSPADLHLALSMRARDLLGLSEPSGFYLPPEARS